MGRNSQQRRAAGHDAAGHDSGPARLTDATIEGMVVNAARVAFGAGEHKAAFAQAVSTLAALEVDPVTSKRPGTIVRVLLHRCVTSLYENGWQPADIAHAVKRQWTVRASRLVVAVIATEARGTDAVHRAPQPWLAQLDDLGVYDPTRASIVGGYDNSIAGWSRAERLHPEETLAISVQVLAQMMMSGRQAVLIEPPSAWPASNRGALARPPRSSGDIDAKALKLIRALLAKAEATTFEAEAETFTAKAQEMMTRYSIDAAVLASAGRSNGIGNAGIESRRVHIDSPYADEKAAFLSVIADVNGARSIWSPHVGFATVMGFPVDLHLTDLVFTSLLLQATRASAEATATDRQLRTPTFRRAFLIAFADRIGERLEATKRHASAEAQQHYGTALVPILADRDAAVSEAYTRTFPDSTLMPTRRLDANGWHAGRAAADRAQIGAGEAIAQA